MQKAALGMGRGNRAPGGELHHPNRHEPRGDIMGRYLLLWMLGIPLPILLLIWMFGGLH